MTTVQDITNSSIATSTSASTTKSSSSSAAGLNSLGKQDFLTLLVAQLKNQDPLNPTDATDFTAQLAQFSSLEQLTNMNTSMSSMLSNSNTTSALNMIGAEVSYASNNVTYSGKTVQVGYSLSGPASAVQLLLQDASGNTIRAISGTDLTAGNHVLTWDGRDQSGNTVESGTYKIVVQASGLNSTSITASPIITSQVTGVDLNSGGTGTTVLNTAAGDVDLSKVVGIYSPSNT